MNKLVKSLMLSSTFALTACGGQNNDANGIPFELQTDAYYSTLYFVRSDLSPTQLIIKDGKESCSQFHSGLDAFIKDYRKKPTYSCSYLFNTVTMEHADIPQVNVPELTGVAKFSCSTSFLGNKSCKFDTLKLNTF